MNLNINLQMQVKDITPRPANYPAASLYEISFFY